MTEEICQSLFCQIDLADLPNFRSFMVGTKVVLLYYGGKCMHIIESEQIS